MRVESVEMPADAVLCYVAGDFAFFTTQPLEKQWGDDWNDAPYECNAGEPYRPHRASEDWQIIRLAFIADLMRPCDEHWNSPWSVEQINAGAVAWLRPPSWNKAGEVIPAETTLADFITRIIRSGGAVYVPMEPPAV